MILLFFTGFHRKGLVDMRLPKIAMNYLRHWFLIDSALVLSDWIVLLLPIQQSADGAGLFRVTKSTRSVRILKVLKVVRFVRVGKISNVLSSLFVFVRSETWRTFFHILLMVTFIVIINHYVACGWYWIGVTDGDPNWGEFFSLDQSLASYKYASEDDIYSLNFFIVLTEQHEACDHPEHLHAAATRYREGTLAEAPDEVDAVRTMTYTAWNSRKMGHRAVNLLVHLPPSVAAEMELRRWKGVKSADWDAHCIVRGETSLQTGREFNCFDSVSVVTLILCLILQTESR